MGRVSRREEEKQKNGIKYQWNPTVKYDINICYNIKEERLQNIKKM